METDNKPAWLETLWNVNPRLAEAAEKDVARWQKLETSQDQALNLADVSVSLLKKYMSHVFDCEGVDYVDEIGCGWSTEEFSYEEIKLLKELSEELGNAR